MNKLYHRHSSDEAFLSLPTATSSCHLPLLDIESPLPMSQESINSFKMMDHAYDTPVKMSPGQVAWTPFINADHNSGDFNDFITSNFSPPNVEPFHGELENLTGVIRSTGGSHALMETLMASQREIPPDSADYLLNIDGQDLMTGQLPKMPQGTRKQFLRTKMCPFLIKGKCTNEEFCSYAHSVVRGTFYSDNCCSIITFSSQDQLRPLPDLRQTKLCDETKQGRSCKNPYCTFAHAIYELKQPTPDLITYKTALCFFWKKGKCFNGTKCR